MKNNSQRRLFTLLELLVVCGIFLVLLTLLLGAIGHSKDSSKRLCCQSNIRSISMGIHTFFTEQGHYPHDFLTEDLSDYEALAPEAFVCPATKAPYGLYYVPRELGCNDKYVIGCPLHGMVSFGAGRGVSSYTVADVQLDGEEVVPGTTVSGTNSTISFADGSTAVLNGKAMITASYRTEIQRLHSILRVFEDYGTVNIKVDAAGYSKFEVITPAATVEGIGANFQVRTMIPGGQMVKTKITVNSGEVQVTTPESGPFTLQPGPPTQLMVKLINAHKIPPGQIP